MRPLTISVLAALLAAAPFAQAQSTLGDPAPLIGNQSSAIAGQTAMAGAGGQRASAQELARRKQHGAEHAACREQARQSTRSGSKERAAARKTCDDKFQTQKATWYRPKS